MADLSAFEDSQFDVHKWVNDVLTASPSPAVPRSQRTAHQGSGPGPGAGSDDLASVIMKLQLLAQDSTEAMESCMASMLLAAPRAAHQLSALATEVSELRDTFERVAGRAEGVDGHNHASQEYGYIGQLKLLDGVKTRMDGARSVLSEAANWERRVRDVGPVFSVGDADAAAEHLAALQQSVAVMRDMPESPQREAMLQRFKAQFEDLMRPKFEQALRNDNMGELRNVARAFAKVGILDSLAGDYARVKVVPLVHAWKERRAGHSAVGDVEGEGTDVGTGSAVDDGGEDLAVFLESWLARLRRLLASELRRDVASLFVPSPAPNPTATATAVTSTVPKPGVAVLARLVVEAMEPVGEHLTQGLLRLTAPGALHAFQAAATSCVSIVELFREPATASTVMAAFARPFVPLLSQFAARETAELRRVVKGAGVNTGRRLADIVTAASASVDLVVDAIGHSIGRCQSLSAFATLSALRSVVSTVFREYMTAMSGSVVRVRELEHVVDAIDALASARATSTAGGSSNGRSSGAGAGAGATAGGGSDSDDWLDIEGDDDDAADHGAPNGAVAGAAEPPAWHVFGKAVELVHAGDTLRCGLHKLEATARDHARTSAPFASIICRAVAAGGAATAATSNATPRDGDRGVVGEPAVWSSLQGACVACYLQSTEGASTGTVGRQVLAALATLEQEPGYLFGPCERLVDDFTGAAQRLVYDMLLQPLQSTLQALPSMPAWGRAASRDSYSTQQQAYAASIGQYILALVRLLQQARSTIVPRSQAGIDLLCEMGSAEWRAAASVLTDREAGPTLPFDRSASEVEAAASLSEWQATLAARAAASADVAAAPDSATAVPVPDAIAKASSMLWLAGVTRGIVALFMVQVLKIPSLTSHGAVQLGADMDYIINLMTALGLHAGESCHMAQLRDLLTMPADQLAALVARASSLSATPEVAAKASFRRRVAKMRGIVTTF